MITAVALVDLDDTLFQTRRKCPVGLPAESLTPFSYTAEGEAISFATPKQVSLIRWLENHTYLIVVTARSTDALTRTRIRYRRAVVAHGGGIVDHHPGLTAPDRRFRAAWRRRMCETLNFEADLDQMVVRIQSEAERIGVGVRVRVISEDGVALYVVAKHALADGNDLELQAACAPLVADCPPGWTVHSNGNNFAFLPPGLGKALAVEWLLPQLRDELADLPILGIGDSLTDASFMSLCDLAITPTASQLWAKLAGAGSS